MTSKARTLASTVSTGAVLADGTVNASEITNLVIPTGPTVTAVASGSLSDGSTVIVNADGTVSVVAATAPSVGTSAVFASADTNEPSATYDPVTQRIVIAYTNNATTFGTAVVGTVSGTSISFGTPVVFRSASTSSVSATYDSTAQRVVIAYRDNGNSSFGTAVVGTVSGTTISFGTPVVFQSTNSNDISATYDSVTQRVVIAYRNFGNSQFGTAIVGTVSGTSISFGSAVVFVSAIAFVTKATYDSAAQRVVIAYQNGSTNFGTAVVGTVSGTSISFGTPVVFAAVNVSFSLSVAYDANAQRIVIAYRDGNNSTFGTAVVGTVSGTSISFGTPVIFQNTNTANIAITYDSNAKNVVIVYRNNGNSAYGTAIVGAVSGTSISFSTPTVFANSNTSTPFPTYDSVTQRVVIAYRNEDNSAFGTAVVFTNISTNLTTKNFIGFSNAAYTNGQTATIQIVGAVDDAQSGLTPGQSYFVQGNGTLGLTPATPSVFAGTAVASNKIIVKG